MTGNDNNWAYCRIEAQVQEDGMRYWLQFRARLDEPNKIVARSERVPLEESDYHYNTQPKKFSPQKSNVSHQGTLNNFLETLLASGWELLPPDNDVWWQRRLRHKDLPAPSLMEKIKRWF